MPTFQYNIITGDGVPTKGQINSTSHQIAVKTLEREGAKVVSIVEVKKKNSKQILIGRKVLTAKKLVTFTRQLSSLIGSGVPLLRSLRTLQRQSEKADPLASHVIKNISDDVESGDYFSEAISRQKSSFPQFYLSMIEAAEASGAMDKILDRLATFMEKGQKIRRKIISAMTYPLVILTFSIIIVWALMVFLVPKIAKMFTDLTEGKEELPKFTEIVINISKFLGSNIVLMIVAVVGAFVLFKVFVSFKGGKAIFDRFKLLLPVIGKIYKRVILARFARNLSLLLNAGVPILTSLDITDKSCDNAVVSSAMGQISTRIQDGENLGKILTDYSFFPVMMISMIEVGEESGSLPEMLDKVADLYESEVEGIIESLSSIIEPILLVLLAVVIGSIVIALFLPMIKLMQTLGQSG